LLTKTKQNKKDKEGKFFLYRKKQKQKPAEAWRFCSKSSLWSQALAHQAGGLGSDFS